MEDVFLIIVIVGVSTTPDLRKACFVEMLPGFSLFAKYVPFLLTVYAMNIKHDSPIFHHSRGDDLAYEECFPNPSNQHA